MKKIFLLLIITFISISCGSDSKSVESIIETHDLIKIREKRNEIVSEQLETNNKLKLIDEAITRLDTVKKMPLVTAFQVKHYEFTHYLELQGNVATKKNIILYPEFSGLLNSIKVTEGQKVLKGQLLATIDDGGMSQQLAQMEVQYNFSKTTFERQQRLWDQKIGSEIEYLQAKATYEGQENAVNQMRSQLSKTAIRAPFSGIIDNIITEQGTVVGAGQSQIIRLINLDKMFVEAEIPESYLNNITVGKTVEVFFPILEKTFSTKVSQVSNYINPSNRTFKITINIPNKEKSIKPNLTAKIKINDYSSNNAILIPQSIISENALGEQYVFTATKTGTGDEAIAKKVFIKTGKTQGDLVEITEGISNYDIIVKEGARNIKDGQHIAILNLEDNE
ncbi:MAG: efflux RND transporter periplasmic adaptor subunit [Flavobacteriaceae bacterium]|nr:efflux RND transporter periplasmic adaptor subunit [Flavobacteriaceae bacterium]